LCFLSSIFLVSSTALFLEKKVNENIEHFMNHGCF
jgi:hypothetical protein